MSSSENKPVKSRTVRFHKYGEPFDVLQLEDTEIPPPSAKRVRVRVHACGLNPADSALCRGLFPGKLPRGIGLDVSGVVDAVGEGVEDATVGDAVFGPADFASTESAGAADFAILQHWTRVPGGLDMTQAAALPLSVATAYGSLDALGVRAGQTVVIHGAGTTVGFAAVQIALQRGARVIATAGQTFADRLRALGATVTSYGDGMAERVLGIIGDSPVLILDTAPPSGVLPALVKIAGDPKRVMTITDFPSAKGLGVRSNIEEPGMTLRYDVLGEFAQLEAEGKFSVPIARTFPLTDWRTALEVIQSQKAKGKLMLIP